MKSKTKVRDRVRDETEKIRKTTKKLNSKIMEKVKIKRVKRNKKKITTGEKVLAAVGLGSTLLGGAGSVSSQPKATQFVRTQESEKGSKTQSIKDKLREIFGIKQAKAAGSVDAAQAALTAAQNALNSFDAWVASATADVPLFAPEDQAARQQEIDAEVASTRPGLVQAVSAAQAEYNQAVLDAQGPHEGDTKSEGGFSYTFYQGGWVLNNGQTKTENGISYGSEGGQWILLDGQTKTEGGLRYTSSGGQWVQQAPEVQTPQIGEIKTGADGYQYVFSNSVYSTGAWTLVDGQTKTADGRTYLSSGGQWVEQQTGPREGDTKTENGLGYHFSNGQWIDNAGNRVQNPNTFWYIADGNGDWTLADGQSKSEGGFQYGSLGGGWILLDGQTKTENGMEYISSGGQWVEKPAGVEAPKIGDVQTGADGYQYVFSNSLYSTGAWTLVDGQTKTENGKNYTVQGGAWVQEQTGAQEGDIKTENGLSYHFTGGQWVDDAGNRVQNPNTFWYIADGSGGWTLEDGQTKTENGKNYKTQNGAWVEVVAGATVDLNNLPESFDLNSDLAKSLGFSPDAPVLADSGVPAQYVVVGDTVYKWQNGSFVKLAQGSAATTFINGASGMNWYQNGGGVPGSARIFIGAGTGAIAGAAIGSMFTVAATAVTSSITFAGAAGASVIGGSVTAGSTAGPIGAAIGAVVGGAIMGIQAIVNRGQDKVRDTQRIESAYPYFNEIMQQYWSITPSSPEEAKALHDAAQQAIQGIFDQIQFEKDSSRTDQQRWLQQNFYNGLDENLTNWQNSFQNDFNNLGVFEQPNGTRIASVGSWGQIRVDASGKLLSWENQNDIPPPPSVIAAIINRTETTKIGVADTGVIQTGVAGVTLTPSEVIAKAQAVSWNDLSPEEQKIFTDYFSNGQHIADIPANFSADSSFAYALGLGGAREGDTKDLNGISYKLEGGNWVAQTPEDTPKINYEVWRTDQGVGAYYNEQYGFVTLTNDGRLIDQNGNVITESIVGNYQLQGLMFQLNSARQNNTVQNPDFVPAASVASLTGQALIDQAGNGSVDWSKLTPAQQQELVSHFGGHPELLPQTIAPGSALAYMLGLGASTDINDPTVKANAEKAGLEFKDGQWVTRASSATPTVTFTTNGGSTTTPKVGDTWIITITGPVGAPVFSTANGSTTQMGVIGPDGKLVLTGTFQAGDVGTWNQQWTVGEGASQLKAGNVDFQLTASQSNQVQQTVPFGLETVSFTVKDNGNGTFSIIYNGTILVTGSSKADIDAARAKFPFMYSTPEAVILSTVSNGFNNYFLTTGSQIKLDNGTRTTVSTTENREVFRDGSGNAAAYFNEFGGRIYYNKATGDLYREDKNGNYVKMGLAEISPQTRQNIINALTGTGANIKVTTVTHNLLSELGQPVKGPNLKQDPKDGNWYVTDDKGNYVLDANGKRIQANLQRFVWSPGGWSSWGYNTEGLNEELAKYSSKQYTVDVVTAPNGTKSYTLTATLPDGKPVSRTFVNASEFNNFLATNFATSNAFMDMSPADKAIFMAATDARIHFPELTAAFIGSTPAASTNHRVIWRNPNNGMLEVQGLINPAYMSTYQQAQSLQSLFPGSQIKERLPLGWPGVMAYEYDPSDPRRVFEVILSDGTVLNVSNAMGSIKLDGQTLTVQGFPQNVINQMIPPAGTNINALFVGGVGYGSAADNANAANGLVEPGSFGPSANPTYSGAIVPLQWLNLGNGQGGIVDPASPYTTNLQNGLNPNQGVVNTGVKPTTTTTSTTTILNSLFTLPINTGSGSGSTGTGGFVGGNTGGTGTGVGTGTQQAAPMPSIIKVSSQKLKPGDTIQITGQNITQGTTLAELVNQKGNVVGLTVLSSTSGSMTVKLPQAGLVSGQYTLQLRFVGTGANFGKVSSGVPVSVESTIPAGAAGVQTGTQGQVGIQSATGQTAQLAAPISVGEDLGKNPANGKSVFLTHLAVYTENNVNTSSKVAPGSIIELGGQGLSAFNKYSLVLDGQEYEIKKFSAGDNVIKLTVPTNLPASIPAGSAVQVKLYSAYQGVKQGAISQELLYAGGGTGGASGAVSTNSAGAASSYDQYIQNLQASFNQDSASQGQDQDTENQVIEYDNALADTDSSNQGLTDTGNEDALSQDLEPEVETTADTETDTLTESAEGEEVEAAEDTVATDSASQEYWNNLNKAAGTASGNGTAAAKLLKVNALGDSSGQKNLSDSETEAENGEESDVAVAGSSSASYWNGLNASGGNGVAGGSGSGSSGGAVQIRGGTNGIRGTVSTLGTADQGWTGGLRMPAGYPASGGLRMPDTAASEDQRITQAEAVTYKVKKGDTLWSIAKKHYGDGKKWRKILEANLDKVRDPKKLKIGTELVIPKA